MGIVRTTSFALLVGVLLGCVAPPQVAPPGSDALRRRFSAEEVGEVLREEGYGSVSVQGTNVSFKADGMSYLLSIYEDGDLQLYFGLTGIEVAPEVVNEWNRTRRLTRAYLDTENDPVLETDLLSDAGLSRSMLVRWVQVFLQGAGLYHAYLSEHGRLESLPAAASPASI